MIITAFKNSLHALLVSAMLLVSGAIFVPQLAYADPGGGTTSASQSAACEGAGIGTGGCDSASAGNKINGVIKMIVNLLSVVVGVVAVIMVIISGFKYITSGGDSNAVASAKSTLVYAIVGLVIVALAQFIVYFVLSNATK